MHAFQDYLQRLTDPVIDFRADVNVRSQVDSTELCNGFELLPEYSQKILLFKTNYYIVINNTHEINTKIKHLIFNDRCKRKISQCQCPHFANRNGDPV